MRKLSFITISCVLAAGLGDALWAEEFDLARNDVEELTVFATRNPTETFAFPGQVSVIGRDQIEDFLPSSVSDLFQGIPGTRFDGGPRRTGEVPSIRGLSGEGVLILLDGARQSFVSGHDGRFFVEPELLRAVEVIRGPGSALYGSGALGGVIALRTVEASDFLDDGETFGIQMKGGYQNVDEEASAIGTAFYRTADGFFDGVASLTYRNSGDIELGSGLALPAENEILPGLLRGKVELTDTVSLTGSWTRFANDAVDPSNPQGNNLAGSTNPQVDRSVRSNTARALLEWAPESPWIDLNLTAYYSKNSVEEDETESPRVTLREVETWGVSFDNRSRFSFSDQFDVVVTYGAEYYEDEQIGRDNQSVDGTRGGVPDAMSNFFGAFVQAEATLEKPLGLPGTLSVIPGVRYDRFKTEASGQAENDDTALSPKIGLSYQPTDWLLFFGNYAEAFRAPSFNETFADGIHFSIPVAGTFPPVFVNNDFISNPDLQPEDSSTWEAGAGLDFDGVFGATDTLRLKGSYWHADVTNLIDLEVDIPFQCFIPPSPFLPPCVTGGTSRNVNVTDAKLDGFEIEANYDSGRFYARATYSGIDGIDADTDEFVGILTPNRFYVDAGMRVNAFDMRLGARATIAAAFDEVNNAADRRPSYEVFDLYAVWEPADGPLAGLRLDLGVDNVGDENYEIVNAGVSEAGRNFKAALTWRQTW